jgi:hypothetical protein
MAEEVTNMSAKKETKKRGRPAKIVQDTVQDVPDVPLKALILGICNNPTWVRGRIDGFSVNVKCSAQVSRRLLGKEVSVTLVHSDLGDYYQYIA